MSLLGGIFLGMILACLILILIGCIGTLSTLEYAGTHIDSLAQKVKSMIESGKEANKNRKEENKSETNNDKKPGEDNKASTLFLMKKSINIF